MRALALVAAVAAAVVIPGAPSGVGVTLVAVLVAATALTAARRTRDLAVFGAFALTLVSFPTLLDAQWVVKVDVLAAWVCATFAVGGPRLISAIAPVIAVPAIPALLPRPSSRAVPAFRAAAIALVVAVPFAALFLTADAAFAAIADNTPRPTIGSAPGRIVAFCVVLLAALALALAAKKELKAPAGLRPWRLSVVEWAVPLVVLNALFLAFVTVQVAVLFGGNDHVVRTAGLTYAEYARQGFWQLIAAAALTLVVVKGATLSAFPRSRSERLLLKALLGFLCALTIVIVASALHRLRLYEDAYGLTRPRFAAEAFALWLGGTFLLVVLLGAAGRARELPWLGSAWAAIALVGFSFANPDARIAQRNIDRWRETGRIDIGYLSTLSADAAPALGRLPTQLRRQALREISRRLADDEPWTSANLSRARARRQLANAVAEGRIKIVASNNASAGSSSVIARASSAVASTRVRRLPAWLRSMPAASVASAGDVDACPGARETLERRPRRFGRSRPEEREAGDEEGVASITSGTSWGDSRAFAPRLATTLGLDGSAPSATAIPVGSSRSRAR